MGDVVEEANGGQLDIGPEVFDIYSSHLASCLSDENDQLESEIQSLCPFRDYLSSVEIKVDGCTIKLPGLGETYNYHGRAKIGDSSGEEAEADVPGIPVSSISDGDVGLYISNQLVVRLPEEVADEGGERMPGVKVYCEKPYEAVLMGAAENIVLHGRLEGLTDEDEELAWAIIRELPNVTFHPTHVYVGMCLEATSQKFIVSSARDVLVLYYCERLEKTDREKHAYKEQLEEVQQLVGDIESVEDNESNIDEVLRIREMISKFARQLEQQINARGYVRENLLKVLAGLDCDIAGKEDPTSDDCDEDTKALHIVFGIAGGRGIGLTRRRVNLQEQVRVLNRIKTTVLFGRLHTASGDFTAIDITKGKEIDGGEGWVIGLEGIFGSVRLRNLSHLHLCLCGVITRDAAVTVVMLPNTPFEALAQYRYSNGVTVSCALQLQFSETNERVDLAIGEQLYHRMGGGLELAVEYQAKVIPITVEVPMDNSIVSIARTIIEAESR